MSPEFRGAERATGSSGDIEELLTGLDRTLRQAQTRSGDGASNASVDDAVARVRAEVATIIGAAREHADRIVDDARQLAQRLVDGGETAEWEADLVGSGSGRSPGGRRRRSTGELHAGRRVDERSASRPAPTEDGAPESSGPALSSTVGSAGPGIDALAPVGVGLPVDAPSPKPSHSVDLGAVGFANELDPTDEEWLTSLREAVIDERPLDALDAGPDPALAPGTEQTDAGTDRAVASRRRWRRGRS